MSSGVHVTRDQPIGRGPFNSISPPVPYPYLVQRARPSLLRHWNNLFFFFKYLILSEKIVFYSKGKKSFFFHRLQVSTLLIALSRDRSFVCFLILKTYAICVVRHIRTRYKGDAISRSRFISIINRGREETRSLRENLARCVNAFLCLSAATSVFVCTSISLANIYAR